jgi:hypothetical protein
MYLWDASFLQQIWRLDRFPSEQGDRRKLELFVIVARFGLPDGE